MVCGGGLGEDGEGACGRTRAMNRLLYERIFDLHRKGIYAILSEGKKNKNNKPGLKLFFSFFFFFLALTSC